MARKLRVEYPGAIYHVMNRGDRREPIFNDDEDRKRFGKGSVLDNGNFPIMERGQFCPLSRRGDEHGLDILPLQQLAMVA